jgi:hypothetical protein
MTGQRMSEFASLRVGLRTRSDWTAVRKISGMKWSDSLQIMATPAVGLLAFGGSMWGIRRQLQAAQAADRAGDIAEHRRWRCCLPSGGPVGYRRRRWASTMDGGW